MTHAVFTYDVTQWLLFFYIYSFFGWIVESTYVSICQKRFVNRGFMRGPFLPLYGSGAVLMLFVSIPVENHLLLVYLSGCVAATALEYVTGVCMEALFKVRYWDYSNQKFNYKGQICLSSTLAWGFLTIFLVRVIHRPIERFVLGLHPYVASALAYVLTIVVAVDMALSVKAALDLRDVLTRMTALKADMELMQRRADVMYAFAEEDMRERRENREKRREERREELEKRLEGAFERLESTLNGLENRKGMLGERLPEFESLKVKLEISRERMNQVRSSMNFYSRKLLRNSPTATSREFKEVLKELKEELDKKVKKQEKE